MKILIISGAGILSGTYLYNKFIDNLLYAGAFSSECEFPEITLHSYPFKSINIHGDLNEELAIKELQNIIYHHNADYVLIACNTMHSLQLNIKGLLSLPLLAIKKFKSINGPKKALVICSALSKKKNIFKDIDIEYLPSELQPLCDRWIASNILKKTLIPEDKENFKNYMLSNGFTHLIIGCTELSMMNWENLGVNIIDSLQESMIAASNIILRSLHESL